jgi:molybdopterin molybdotransferase
MPIDDGTMLSFDEARRRILEKPRLTGLERVPLALAGGRVLAEALVAREPLPRFDHSAMDGYAVAAADLSGDGPWTLRVVGESAAGAETPTFARGTACRIFTGAPLPDGTDAVIMQEHAPRQGDAIRVEKRPAPGAHVRRAGEDLPQGDVALPVGTRLGPAQLALAAMLDRAEVVVSRRPIVTIVCTGDELRGAGEGGIASSIPESNSAPIAALARQAGAEVRVAPIARDEPAATLQAITDALRTTDLLVTIGGVSVGDHDIVRPALERAGVDLAFWKVAIKPGKPIAFGRGPTAAVLGLPGNPASAMVTFAVFGMPLLRAMQRDAHPLPLAGRAKIVGAYKRSPDRLELARVALGAEGGNLGARPLANQSSGAATSLASSDGIALIHPDDTPLPNGAHIDVYRWTDL